MNEYTYQEISAPFNTTIVLRSDGACIPTDPANADYQAYLNKDTLPSNSFTPASDTLTNTNAEATTEATE